MKLCSEEIKTIFAKNPKTFKVWIGTSSTSQVMEIALNILSHRLMRCLAGGVI